MTLKIYVSPSGRLIREDLGKPAEVALADVIRHTLTTQERNDALAGVYGEDVRTRILELEAAAPGVGSSGAPAVITGILGVGNLLTATLPLGVQAALQNWTRDDVAISGATSLTYMQVSADSNKTVGFYYVPKVSTTAGLVVSAGVVVPGAPTSIVLGAATSNSQPITWTAPASNGGATITSYRVGYRTPVGSGSYTYLDTGSNTTGYVVPSLTANTQYEYVVDAVNSAGAGPDAVSASGTTATAPVVSARTLVIGTEMVSLASFSTAAGPQDTVAFRARDVSGSGASNSVGLLLPNFVFAAANAGFVASTRAFTLDSVYVTVTVGGTKYTKPLTFAGATFKDVPTTAGHVVSDLITHSVLTDGAVTELPVGTEFWFTGRMVFAAGGGVTTVGAGVSGQGTGNAIFYDRAVATPVGLNTGSVITSTGQSFAWHIPRVAAIGKFVSSSSLSTIELADSIGHGVGDPSNPPDGWGDQGFLSRARQIRALGTNKIAGIRLASSGSQVNAMNLNGAFARDLFPYFNVLTDAWGTNAHPVSTAQERTDHEALWAAAKVAGITAIVKTSLWPASSSTDLWRTASGQTADITRRAASEAWYVSKLAAGPLGTNNFNYYSNLLGMREADTGNDRYKWKTDGTTANLYAWDSIHPSGLGHAAGAASYRATLLSVTV